MSNPGVTNPTAGVTSDDTVSDQTDTSDTTAAEDIETDDTEAETGEGEEATDESQDGEGEGEESGEGEETQTTDEPETIEIEEDGEKFKVPKKLEKALLRMKDYTQKTQAHAETVRAFQAEQTSARAHIRELAQFTAINDQVQAYEQVDWDGLLAQDPDTYHRERRRLETLKEDGGKLLRTIQTKEAEGLEKQRADHAKRIEESQTVLKKDIGWSPELAAKVMDHAANKFGFKPEEISRITDPRIIKVLHAAMTNDQQKKTVAKVQNITKAQETKPVPQARTGSSPTTPKDPNKMTIAQYHKWRSG